MKLLAIIKYVLAIVAIVFLYYDWQVSVGLFLVASIFHVIPMGPNTLLSVITGYLMIGGVVFLFFDWRIGVGLIISSVLVAKFRVWGNKKNEEYYAENEIN